MSDEFLSKEDKKYLLKLAADTIRVYAQSHKLSPAVADEGLSEALRSRSGAFVSLHRRGMLRGCIGIFEGQGRLVDTIQKMAVSAGWQDPRFNSLEQRELPDLEIEISVLTPLRQITDVNEIEVGKHGIYITKGYNRGVLLPQVATEYGWCREEFLDATCQKAGLPIDAWKKGATIEIFSAEVFSEKDLADPQDPSREGQ